MSVAPIPQADRVECVNVRRIVESDQPGVLTDIYQSDVNMVVWQRQLPELLGKAVDAFLQRDPTFQVSMSVSPESVFASVKAALGSADPDDELSNNIAGLVDMFCCLFELKQAGLRLTVLDRPMCPRFHVDKVPCRLITTFRGVATECLPHHLVNREKLGLGNGGLPDDQSGLFLAQDDVCQISAGDVALLKGESWEGNEGAGLVHRSPAVAPGDSRLLLTLDFMS